jgi:hypothetical protein
MSNNRTIHAAILSGVEGILLRLREILLEERHVDGDRRHQGGATGFCIGKLLGRHPGLIGPRLGANDGHVYNSGLAVRAGRAGRKLVKSPSAKLPVFSHSVKCGDFA